MGTLPEVELWFDKISFFGPIQLLHPRKFISDILPKISACPNSSENTPKFCAVYLMLISTNRKGSVEMCNTILWCSVYSLLYQKQNKYTLSLQNTGDSDRLFIKTHWEASNSNFKSLYFFKCHFLPKGCYQNNLNHFLYINQRITALKFVVVTHMECA